MLTLTREEIEVLLRACGAYDQQLEAHMYPGFTTDRGMVASLRAELRTERAKYWGEFGSQPAPTSDHQMGAHPNNGSPGKHP